MRSALYFFLAVTPDAAAAAGTTMPRPLVALYMVLMYGGVLAYPLLQIYALVRLRPPARRWAAVPILFMLPVYIATYDGWARQSNLWPILAILASPVACIILVAVLINARRNRARRV